MKTKVYWSLVILLALVAAGMGVYPHARFSQEAGELSYFFSSYDEGYYSTAGMSGWSWPGRITAKFAITGLRAVCGGNLVLTLIVADAVFPFVLVLVGGFLAASILDGVVARLGLLAAALFFGEFTAAMCLEHVDGWRAMVEGPWRTLVVQGPPILYLFRTPEPQISWTVGMAFLALGFRLARRDDTPPTPRTLLAFAAVSALLGLSYTFFLAGCCVYVTLTAAGLAIKGPRRTALVLIGGVAIATAVYVVTLVLAQRFQTGLGISFVTPTRLPALSPLVMVNVVLLVAWALLLAVRGRSDEKAILGIAASSVPLILLNQQVVTGLALTLKQWEENTNAMFTVVSIGWLIATLTERPADAEADAGTGALVLPDAGPGDAGTPGGGPVLITRLAGHALAAGLGTAVLVFAIGRQRQIPEWFGAFNTEEQTAAALLDEHHATLEPDARILFDTVIMPQRLGIRSRNRYAFVANFDTLFVEPIPNLHDDPARTGVGSPHATAILEFMWRRGITTAELRTLLEREAAEHATILTFFFSFQDAWGPLTTWRARQVEPMTAAIPSIVEAYSAFLAETPDGAAGSVYRVSLESPDELPPLSGLACELIGTRETLDGRVQHLYRQVMTGPAVEEAPPP